MRRRRSNPYGKAPAGKPKAASLLRAFSEQYRAAATPASGAVRSIPRVAHLRPRDFFEHYYYANRPVILGGLMRSWPARRLWSPEYFAREFGDHLIEVSAERDRDPEYDSNFDGHRREMRLRDFVTLIRKRGPANDIYISGKNSLLHTKGFEPLLHHLRCPAGILNPSTFRSNASLFFGPKGTVTHLHFDGSNNLLGQIYGRKLVKLVPPFEMENVYPERYCFSAVDMGRINWKKFPRVRRATILEAVLRPGESLFIPMGWYHWVKALDVSISISMQDFAVKHGLTSWRFWE